MFPRPVLFTLRTLLTVPGPPSFANENGDYRPLATLPGNVLLSCGYTGAWLGLYATANGGAPGDYADFDWAR